MKEQSVTQWGKQIQQIIALIGLHGLAIYVDINNGTEIIYAVIGMDITILGFKLINGRIKE